MTAVMTLPSDNSSELPAVDRRGVPQWLQVQVTDDFVGPMRELSEAGRETEEAEAVPRAEIVRALVTLGMSDPDFRRRALALGAEMHEERKAEANAARRRTHERRHEP